VRPASLPAVLLLLAALAAGCGSAERSQAEYAQARARGDLEGAEQALRSALERAPDDVDLLIEATEFYLLAEPPEHYRPRLALHYGMRADKAANYQRQDAASAYGRAQRAVGFGNDPRERALIQDALQGVRDPDRFDPQAVAPMDPDLLDPTLANFVEQARRRAAPPTPRCGPDLIPLPPGRYPSPEGELVTSGVCMERRPTIDRPPRAAPDNAGRVAVCDLRGLAPCGGNELAIACGPLASVLGDHPVCRDPAAVRCCGALAGAPALD